MRLYTFESLLYSRALSPSGSSSGTDMGDPLRNSGAAYDVTPVSSERPPEEAPGNTVEFVDVVTPAASSIFSQTISTSPTRVLKD